MIEPFTLAVPDRELEDLQLRLRATRWPDPATDPRQGVALAHLQQRCQTWAERHGHFPALEQPEVSANELASFFALVR